MVFSAEDKILIKELRETKGYGAMRLITEFPMKIGPHSRCRQAVKKDCHNRTRIRDVEHLRERLIEEWSRSDQRIIDGAVNQWRQRLRACVRAEGGHFEHQL